MGYYRRSAMSPASGTPCTAARDGGVLIEELMGERRVLGRFRRCCITVGRRARWSRSRRSTDAPLSLTPNLPLSPWHLRTTALDAGTRRRARSCGLARQRCRPHLDGAAARIERAVQKRGRRRTRLRTNGRRRRRVGLRCARSRRGRLRRDPTGTTHRWVIERDDRGRARHREPRACRPTEAVPVGARAVPRAGSVLRARPARAGRTARGRRRTSGRARANERGARPVTCIGIIPSMWSAGTVRSIPMRSRSTTSSRSSDACISLLRCIRPSRRPDFVVCSFVPRPYDFHPDSVKVPYHHANVD